MVSVDALVLALKAPNFNKSISRLVMAAFFTVIPALKLFIL